MIRTIYVFFFLLLIEGLGGGAWAEELSREPAARSEIIEAIKISGHKKIEEDAVRAKLSSRVGEAFSSEKVREDVRALFSTGYFYDVIVDKTERGNKVTLSYKVVEKPTISEIDYDGNSEISDEDLAQASGIKTYEILDLARINEAVEKMEKLYEDKGFFLARVNFRVSTDEKGETAKLRFFIQENEMVKVKKVTFLGNRQIPSGRLKSAMMTKEGGFFSFISGSGSYKQEAFDRDVQMLNYFYFNEGYVQVKIDRPQVYVTPDKTGIYITFRIEEGEQFNIGTVDFAGDLLFSEEELFKSISIKESDLFSYEALQKDLQALQAKYGDLGYAFANIIPRTRVREKERLVDITFEVDRGNKVYIGKINVIGNTRTRDKVIRRELQIREGELYNETRKRESMANVRRLGFFDEVSFNTSTPSESQDIMDIDIVVKERNTGTIQVGAGYSSFAGLVLNGQINQINLFGRGQRLGVSVDINKKQSLFNINFTEPYLWDTEWEAGFDAYHSQRSLIDYDEKKLGGALRIGHPLAPYLRGIIAYKLDDTNLEENNDTDLDLFPVDTVNGLTSSVTLSLVYDKRDDRFAPTDGLYSSLSMEYAGLGGDLAYTKGLANFRYYQKTFWDIVWRNNVTYGFISSNDGSEPPFNELFRLGGANTLRGYDWFTVGRRKYSKTAFSQLTAANDPNAFLKAHRPFGGTQQFFYNMEFQFPMISEAGIHGVVFYDVGDAQNSLTLDDFRSDVGFGFRWYSPIGPLRFEWGFPIDRDKDYGESAVNFNFSIGSPF